MLKEEVIKKDIGLRGDSINEMAMISTELSERHIPNRDPTDRDQRGHVDEAGSD